jgi:pyruvate formate lyase activating enzyme
MTELNGHCTVCIRECEKGDSFCHRRDQNGRLKQGNRFCVFVVDRLFDKPIIHFGKNERILSMGSWGCNLRCSGCQNVHLSWSVDGSNLAVTEMTPDEITDLALEHGCKGICYTFNEPAILLETVESTAVEARRRGLFNVLVTNCTLTPGSAKRIAPFIDAVAADIKSMKDEFYWEYCGASGIPGVAGKILKCIKTFSDAGCHIEIRTNIISGGNDQEDNFREIAGWTVNQLGTDTPWHITRFFPAHILRHIPPTPAGSILLAQKIGLEAGLKHVHTFFGKGCDCADENLTNPGDRTGEINIVSCCG